MDSEKFRDIVIPIILISIGWYYKIAENKNNQNTKKLGKYLVIIGIIALVIRNIDLII